MDVTHLVERLLASISVLHPGVGFLTPRGLLHVSVGPEPVDAVRIEGGRGFLHLHSVALDPVDIDVSKLTDGCSAEASSAWSDTYREVDKELLFDTERDHRPAFHTMKEEAPWLEIRFPHLVTLKGLTLRNVTGTTFGRARGLRVSCRVDGGQWQVVHDGPQQEARLARDLELAVGSLPPELRHLSHPLHELLSTLVAADSPHPMEELERSCPPELTGKAMREVANREILVGRSLEWTSHGIKRSFRFWSAPERRAYVEYASRVVDDLRSLSELVCLGFGSVLAAVRDGDLIPHDDDLDIIIGFGPDQAADLPTALDRLAEHLGEQGYAVTGNHVTHRWVRRREGGPTVDVFVGMVEDGRVGWYPGKRRAFGVDEMFPVSTGTIAGVRCALPRNPLLYLETVYGESWRIPDSGFKHDWNPREYR